MGFHSARDYPLLNSQPVLGGFTGLIGVVAILQDPALLLLQFLFSYRWCNNFPNFPLKHGGIHGGFYDGELASPFCSKAFPNHDTSISMLQRGCEVLFLDCSIWFG
ncbi:hypothetical protein CRENBAI_017626 [Crenichthys baileyi]|uniref:Uncharacterized protein n=1 Tax=Crenichthys baileyi TaxID=28760 RepID=A0AAV9RXD6_9TELE